MTIQISVRIKRDETPARMRVASKALELAGYKPRTVLRNGHPVRVWVL